MASALRQVAQAAFWPNESAAVVARSARLQRRREFFCVLMIEVLAGAGYLLLFRNVTELDTQEESLPNQLVFGVFFYEVRNNSVRRMAY